MRLRQIKLAGFKSFVDPTQIDVPGRLVGVVGPNGCGKSNVIDAVRWVLGESKASELRGESMADVIFNGSVNRKQSGRASVELVFENTDGRIGGAWGQYAEVSVKRVLTRDGASSYYINNQQVRRRDVQDIFLGTGLGPRAYAIIGQGMISRIVEARPEDLRIFLEEAAGVSKYKERRRETENRLSDTRDNLTRVEDILRELDGQTSKLAQQAEVAGRYRELQVRHDAQQHLLWFTRRHDAQAERDKVAADAAAAVNALEGHTAELRATERQLEEVRAAHYASSDAVHEAQGRLYEVNAEIGKLESEIRLILDGRTRLAGQIEALRATRERRLAEHAELGERAQALVQAIGEGELRLTEAQARAADHEATLPAREDAYAAARDAMSTARGAAVTAENAIEAVAAESRSLDRQLAALTQRRERLAQERGQMGAPDEERHRGLEEQLAALRESLAAQEQTQAEAEEQAARLAEERQTAQDARLRESESLTRIEARLAALRQLQANVEANDKLDPWLKAQGLESLPRLFKRLAVEPGWETAVEAVLRERLEALEVGRLDMVAGFAGNAPPARVAFFSPAGAVPRETAPLAAARPLGEFVRGGEAALAAVVGDWLAGVYVADNLGAALAARTELPAGASFIVKAGHRVSRHGVRFYAADDAKAGMLARRQEIENLERELRAQRLIADEALAAAARAESAVRLVQDGLGGHRREVERLRTALHGVQIEAVRLAEVIERHRHRSGQIEGELAEIGAHDEELRAAREEAEARFQSLDEELATAQQRAEDAQLAYEQADAALRAARDEQRRLETEHQQIGFTLAANRERERDVRQAAASATDDAARIEIDVESAAAQLAQLDDSAARAGLDGLLGGRTEAEERLREARTRMDELAAQLRAQDERRLGLEREQQPLRDRITELQLKEQAARLAAEQFAEQLAQAQVDEAALAERHAAEKPRAANLQGEITRLANEIAALGAVNLAALDELASAQERKGFLEAQSTDLRSAIDTLEDAIRKIDRETRDLLQATFDQVNAQFGEMFPKLFGGGEARLIMTGEEILDAGVQVMAQPPGKRNSTIHLLSGGEKALTATALVFAMFKLNPAPFCLLDEVDAPLDDANTERFCALVESMSDSTQFLFITHNKIAMELAQQLVGVTMQEQGVSRIVAVDIEAATRLVAEAA
ncbi:MAG TPA: chromosome segregation protein SMC [Burkholderiaceae bacterium]|nr:chromosome segregation protein SMC [Burkholderiaceae bacterium]